MRCLKIGMAGKPHYVKFPQAFFEPVADRRSPQIVELTSFDSCSTQNLTEIQIEIGNHP
jgi:hypothetical protein